MILRELEQLKQCMQTSTRATAENNPLFELDKSDAHVVQNLKSLVRAAEDFHANASLTASTISSGSHLGTDAMGEYEYAKSGLPPLTNPSKRRHIEMLRWRNRLPSRMSSLTPSGNFGIPPSPMHVNYPEVVVDDETGLGLESDLDSTLSGGLSKMAQKALREFDFPEAEKILQRALERHKISAPDDAHHSRLRTQLAICSFLQGKGSKIDEAVSDLAEFRGTKRPVACQLLYNLALSHIHDFDSEAARKICSKLWSTMSRPDVTDHLDRNNLLRLLVVSYRMSGDTLLAQALEAEHPELARLADDGLPSVLESVISCKELLVEFYGAEDDSEIPRLFIHQLRSQAELSEKSAFELSRTKQHLQREAEPGRPTSGDIDDTRGPQQPFLRQKADMGSSSYRKTSDGGKFMKLRTILRRQYAMNEGDSDTSPESVDTKSCREGSTKKSTVIVQEDKIKSCARLENKMPLWQRVSPWHRRKRLTSSTDVEVPTTDENGDLVLAWLRGQSIMKKRNPESASTTASVCNSTTSLHRKFSFVGMPSTPSEGNQQLASMLSGKAPIPELHDTPLFEMMDTSPRVELSDTGLTPFDILKKHSHFARSDSITSSRISNRSQFSTKGLEFTNIDLSDTLKEACGRKYSASTTSSRIVNCGQCSIKSLGMTDVDAPDILTQTFGRNEINQQDHTEKLTSVEISEALHGYYGPPYSASNLSDGKGSKGKIYLESATDDNRPGYVVQTSIQRSNTGKQVDACGRSDSCNDWGNVLAKERPEEEPSGPLEPAQQSIEFYSKLGQDAQNVGSPSSSNQHFPLPSVTLDHIGDQSPGDDTSNGPVSQLQIEESNLPEDHRFVSETIKAVRSRLRLLNQTRRATQRQKGDSSPREPSWSRKLHAMLQSTIFARGKQTFSIRQVRKVPQTKIVHEYQGPDAVPGPFTNEEGELPQSPCKFEFGVPDLPDSPRDIRVPVELDSRPIKVVRYA